jgi:DNA-binding transcriptional LysR family regulator
VGSWHDAQVNWNWDDIRFVLELSRAGTLARTAKKLGVDHTTVGRRIESAEAALGMRLFTRTSSGYVPTREAEQLIPAMNRAEEAMLGIGRSAHPTRDTLEGHIRVTSPETFGVAYLAPTLGSFIAEHPHISVELVPSGEVLNLGRREAEIALRPFKSKEERLIVRRAATLTYGFYATPDYLRAIPLTDKADLIRHRVLSPPEANAPETIWLKKLQPKVEPAFTSTLSLALCEAARASAGVAILPRYLGDAESTLTHVALPDPPREVLWLTIHRDLQRTPRVRALFDYLVTRFEKDASSFAGST